MCGEEGGHEVGCEWLTMGQSGVLGKGGRVGARREGERGGPM